MGSTDLGTEDQTTTTDTGTTDLGADPDPELNPDGTPKEPAKDDKTEPPKYFGAPEGGVYPDPVLPDGFPANPELKSKFDPIAAELGLNPEGYQKLVDFQAELNQQQTETWSNHVKELKTIAQADPEIGGNKYPAALAAGKAVIAKFGTPALRQMMNAYGVGAHPEMIRFMANVAKATGETPSVQGGDTGGTVTEKPLHEILYTNS